MIKVNARRYAAFRRVGAALMLAAVLLFINVSPAAALDLNPKDYFQLEYDPITFDKSEITGDEVFQVTVAGRLTCTQNIPLLLPVREAFVTSQVIAQHTTSGAEVTLNEGYTINVKPFPDREGDTIDITQTAPLQFPVQSASGNYTVIGRILKAEVKFIIGSMDVTSFLPREQPMGTVKYTAPDSSSVQVTTTPPSSTKPPTETTSPSSTEPPAEITPAATAPPPSSPTPAASPGPEPVKSLIPWWVGLIVFIAITTTVFYIIWFLRHRRKEL